MRIRQTKQSKDLSIEDVVEARRLFAEMIASGRLDVATGVREMRTLLRVDQTEFARRFGLTTRQVSELENGKANPTAGTLRRLGAPFGLVPGFVKKSAT